MELDEEGLTQIAKRIRNLVRAVNIRRGMRRKDEKPPADHWKRRFPELEEELLNAYYTFKGWNEQGIPTQESLRRAVPGLRGRGLSRAGHPAGRESGPPGRSYERGKSIVKVEKKKKIVKTIRDRRRQVQRVPGVRGHLLLLPRDAEVQQQQPRAISHPGDSLSAERPLRPRLRRRVRRGRVRGQRQVHDRRQGVRRVRLLPGLLPVPGRLQGTRLRPASEVRHV